MSLIDSMPTIFTTYKMAANINNNSGEELENRSIEIVPHPECRNPTRAWKELSNQRICEKVKPLNLNTQIYPDKVRFVCISDTHAQLHKIIANIPKGDVLLHAGDFTRTGTLNEVRNFNVDLGKLSHAHKIVIAGNHELSFDSSTCSQSPDGFDDLVLAANLKKFNVQDPRELLTNCIYLEDSGTEVYGISIYGSPLQPEFGGWAFNIQRGETILKYWNKIPYGVDVLMTHGPPIGHGDMTKSKIRAGCVELLNTVEYRVKPKVHVFGHIHEDHGITTNGVTKFINACVCDLRYKTSQPPIIFDLPLPKGMKKNIL